MCGVHEENSARVLPMHVRFVQPVGTELEDLKPKSVADCAPLDATATTLALELSLALARAYQGDMGLPETPLPNAKVHVVLVGLDLRREEIALLVV